MTTCFQLTSLLLVLALFVWNDRVGAIDEPPLPKDFHDYNFIKLNSENGLCPYLKRGTKKVLAGCWACGLGHGVSNSSGSYTFDCCPGFRRSDIYRPDTSCSYVKPTYQTIIEHLKADDKKEAADLIELYLAENQDVLNSPITFFTTKSYESMNAGEVDYESNPEAFMPKTIARGRIYSRDLKNKGKIRLLSGDDLKVTTYSNGLVFLECRTLINPDHETKNGIIHILDAALPDTSKNPTLYARLQSMPEVSEFLNDIPSDMTRKLEDRYSGEWLTVLAPINKAWTNIRDSLDRNARDQLWRNHVINKMICSGAITESVSAVGPTMSGEHVGMVLIRTGDLYRPQVVDACGNNIWMSQVDLMAGNGVVHQVADALAPLGSKDLQETLRCMAATNKHNVKQAVDEFTTCGISASGTDNIVLLPTDDAIQKILRSPARSKYNSDRCTFFRHHVLKAGNSNGVIGQQTVFDTNAGKQVVSTFIRERDDTKLYFNNAKVKSQKAQPFANGKIYVVSSMAVPPTKDITSVVAEQPETAETVDKMRQAGIDRAFRQASPNLVFLASMDLGWSTRDEKDYSSNQLESLFRLHTIPQTIFGGDDGFIGRETVMQVDSMLTDRSGRPVQLTIKRYLDGNTFVGHNSLPESEWSMITKWNLIANEGNVWIIDWPMKCPPGLC